MYLFQAMILSIYQSYMGCKALFLQVISTDVKHGLEHLIVGGMAGRRLSACHGNEFQLSDRNY